MSPQLHISTKPSRNRVEEQGRVVQRRERDEERLGGALRGRQGE